MKQSRVYAYSATTPYRAARTTYTPRQALQLRTASSGAGRVQSTFRGTKHQNPHRASPALPTSVALWESSRLCARLPPTLGAIIVPTLPLLLLLAHP